MKIDVMPLGHIAANCYMLLSNNAAVVIDPGIFSQKVEDFLNDNSEKDRLILLTHAHFDHICGADRLRKDTGVKIAVGEKDAPALIDTKLSLSDKFHAHQPPFEADILLKDNAIFNVGDIEFKSISTPGHTVGGMCYLTGKTLFSGDTLFLESVGRTDFPGGESQTLLKSIKRLLTLDEEITVYPGHGEPTTVKHERIYNPFIRGDL